MQTSDDLNNGADAMAALYDGLALFTADPGVDGSNLAGGGDVQAITFSAGGVDGPSDDHAPIDGICWSSVMTATLTEVATHFGLFDGATFRRGEPLPHPVGPGVVHVSVAVGPAAQVR